MTAWLTHLSRPFTRDRALLGGVALSLTVGMLFYSLTAAMVENDAAQRFSNMSLAARATIVARIKSYADLLRGSASLFATSTELTRSQFHHYVEGLELDKNFPGVQTINYARYIDNAERQGFEKKMNEEAAGLAAGYPAFKITPPGQRSSYTVLTFIEPISAWARRYGWDIAALGKNEAMELSRDTGELCASGAPIAPLSGDNRVGLAMRLPIYRNNMPLDNVVQRRAAYRGSVGIGFSVNKLMAGVLDQFPVRDVSLLLKDVSEVDAGVVEERNWSLLFDSASAAAKASRAPQFSETLSIDFGKRRWQARFSVPSRNLYSNFNVALPWVTMALGSISTFLLFSLFQAISASRRNAVSLATSMTSELRTSQAKLQRSNENLRRLAAHTNNIKEDERRRIAREIHDELGQSLLALRIEADMLAGRTSGHQPRLHARAIATVRQIDATIKSVRQIINDLRPGVLDLGLSAAVEWQVKEFRRRTGVECQLIEPHGEVSVSEQCATALFRILQESLSNIARHAKASKACVELSLHGGWIAMSISDNGIGIAHRGRRRGSFGLVGIEERMNILNGVFRLDSVPGEGTTIHISVPANADPVLPTEFLEMDEPLPQLETA
ncbi:MAG: CHASE domain-containing protein [Massilia sp.]